MGTSAVFEFPAIFISNQPTMIRNIIFDYGGVIIDLDFDRLTSEFEKLGVAGFDQHRLQLHQAGVFDRLDKGQISEAEFRQAIRQQTGASLTDEQIDSAWNSLIAGVKEEKIKTLTKLISSHKTFLLSNTNFIHLKAITKYLLRTYGRVNLDSLFDKVYYSCVLGLRKPEKEIYQKVINDSGLKPSQTLYIDDSPEHVEGAAREGLIAVLYDPAEPLGDFLNRTLQQLNQPG
jgi:putative hydrolase of the HAD superfamily